MVSMAAGGLCGAPDGAWRWENWGKGRGERDDLKKGKEQKTGLKSKMKGGKRRRRMRILS